MKILRKVLRFMAVVISGVFGGALLGAVLLGVTGFAAHYGSQGGSFFGPLRELWKFMAIIGAIFGVVPGFVIGVLVAITGCRKLVGCLSGSAVGMVVTVLILMGFLEQPQMLSLAEEVQFLVLALAPIPLSGLLGTALASIRRRLAVWRGVVREIVLFRTLRVQIGPTGPIGPMTYL